MRRHRYDTIADGIGLDRVTANFREARVDDAIRVADQDALVMAHYLLRFEGLFLGSSSALNCVAALRAGAELRRSSSERLTVVTVLCDGGARYLSRFWNREFVEKRGLVWPPEDSGALAALVERLVAREESVVEVHCYVHKLSAQRLPPAVCGAAPACALIGTPSRRGRRLRRARAPRPA